MFEHVVAEMPGKVRSHICQTTNIMVDAETIRMQNNGVLAQLGQCLHVLIKKGLTRTACSMQLQSVVRTCASWLK